MREIREIDHHWVPECYEEGEPFAFLDGFNVARTMANLGIDFEDAWELVRAAKGINP